MTALRFSLIGFLFLLHLPSAVLADTQKPLPDLSNETMANLITAFYEDNNCPDGALAPPASTDSADYYRQYKECVRFSYHYLREIAKRAPAYYAEYKRIEDSGKYVADLELLRNDFLRVAKGEAAWNAFFAASSSLNIERFNQQQGDLYAEALIQMIGGPHAPRSLDKALNFTGE